MDQEKVGVTKKAVKGLTVKEAEAHRIAISLKNVEAIQIMA